MESKKAIIGIDNFKTLKSALMLDATEVSNKGGAVVYARCEPVNGKNTGGVMIAGNGLSILWGIARIIHKVSNKSGIPTGEILEAVKGLIEVINNEN